MQIDGEYEVTIDQEGRMPMPDACQAWLRRGGFLTRSFNGISLTIYPTEIGDDVAKRLTDPTQDTDPLTERIVRFLACGVTVSLNANGEIRIPCSLARLAHLQREVIVRDTGDRLEIWDASARCQCRGNAVSDDFVGRTSECLAAR